MDAENYAKMVHQVLPDEDRPFSDVLVVVVNRETDEFSITSADPAGNEAHPRDINWLLYCAGKAVDQDITFTAASLDIDRGGED